MLGPRQARVLEDATIEQLQQGVMEFTPSMVYICGQTSFEADPDDGVVGSISFQGALLFA
jgi:hypothetical protein